MHKQRGGLKPDPAGDERACLRHFLCGTRESRELLILNGEFTAQLGFAHQAVIQVASGHSWAVPVSKACLGPSCP